MTLADRLNKIISEQNMTKREFAARWTYVNTLDKKS